MPDNIQTEEQEQVKQLLKRWHRLSSSVYPVLFGSIIGTAGIIAAMYISKSFGLKRTDIMFISQITGTLIIFFITIRAILQRYKFASRLSTRDIQLLEKASELLGVKDAKMATDILNTYKSSGYSNRDQFLRPSQQPENNDTLLRAAAYTDNTPQEQLLRPSLEE